MRARPHQRRRRTLRADGGFVDGEDIIVEGARGCTIVSLVFGRPLLLSSKMELIGLSKQGYFAHLSGYEYEPVRNLAANDIFPCK